MAKQKKTDVRLPLILRFHRLMDAFAKSDDERDFYLNTVEGFIIFADLDKNLEDFDRLEESIKKDQTNFLLIPKMTFYETKKFMEGFINEKVYDIDTKEKLLDIIQSKEARENFLEFIYDHLAELEKWQQYYHERSRIRIIEWLRSHGVHFAFEEDLDIEKNLLEKVKQSQFSTDKVSRDVQSSREVILAKAKTYYSNEALNPRPKRGRPPKQAVKVAVEPQYTLDIYKTVTSEMRPYLFVPDVSSAVTFSAKFDTEAQLIASLRGGSRVKIDSKLEALSQRLESLRHLSDRLRSTNGLGIENDQPLLKSISNRTVEKQAPGKEGKKGQILNIAKGFLPSKKNGTGKKKSEIQEIMHKKRQAGIKQVTPILPNKKKKKNT